MPIRPSRSLPVVAPHVEVGEPGFYGVLLRLALPLALQQLVVNALNAVDVLLVGQLGDTAVAAVGLANQVYFLLSLFLFGVGSGAVIFSAQSWGRRDVHGVRQVLGLALLLGITGSALFTLAAVAFPSYVLDLYSDDPAVIALGSNYLRVVGLCYLPIAANTMYGMILRSTRHVHMPTAVTVAALSFKTLLAYGLIFGHFGLPAMGVVGAALATCIARAIECTATLTLTYRANLPAALHPRDLIGLDRAFVSRFAYTAWPVIFGEMLWSLGTTSYSAIYGRIGTDAVAATNIATTIESVALVPFIGLSTAAAVILGNAIGAGEIHRAGQYARRFLKLSIGGALVMGLVVYAATGLGLLRLYQISPVSQSFARGVLYVVALGLWIKATNIMTIVGVLRPGGDTRFALFADTGTLWLIGIPCALVGAFVFHLPVYWVVLMALADEVMKFVLTVGRVLAGGWINNVIPAAPAGSAPE